MRWFLLIAALAGAQAFAQTARMNPRSAKITPREIKAIDKVVIIKAISSTKRSFLVRLGFNDGIAHNQSALFSNKFNTIEARAIEVSSSSSLWEVRDDRAVAPFDKNDIVVFTNNLERKPFEIPELSRVEARVAKLEARKGIDLDSFAVRGSFSRTMSESTTETATEGNPVRQGYQFELMYLRKFGKRWEYSIGVRYDSEVATLESPALDIPTTRLLGTFDLIYHFHSDFLHPHYYASVGIGYGRSTTDVGGVQSSGSAVVLPIARLGRTFDWADSMTFFGEVAFESISMAEKLEDAQEQTTTIVSGKFSVGIRF